LNADASSYLCTNADGSKDACYNIKNAKVLEDYNALNTAYAAGVSSTAGAAAIYDVLKVFLAPILTVVFQQSCEYSLRSHMAPEKAKIDALYVTKITKDIKF